MNQSENYKHRHIQQDSMLNQRNYYENEYYSSPISNVNSKKRRYENMHNSEKLRKIASSENIVFRTSPLHLSKTKRSSRNPPQNRYPPRSYIRDIDSDKHRDKYRDVNDIGYGSDRTFNNSNWSNSDLRQTNYNNKIDDNDWPNGLFTPICDVTQQNTSHCTLERSISPQRNWRQFSTDEKIFVNKDFSSLIASISQDSTFNPSDEPYSGYDSHKQEYYKIENQQNHQESLKIKSKIHSSSPWMDRLQDLLKYKAEYGDCLVPQKFEHNQQLGSWVNKQRVEYKLMQEGKRSSMTNERAEILERVGFVWSRSLRQPSWDSKFRELLKYKEEQGDCLVPTKYAKNPSLGRWVSTQRAQYKLMMENGKTSMTEERLTRLESIGFVWRLHF